MKEKDFWRTHFVCYVVLSSLVALLLVVLMITYTIFQSITRPITRRLRTLRLR